MHKWPVPLDYRYHINRAIEDYNASHPDNPLPIAVMAVVEQGINCAVAERRAEAAA